MSEKKQKLFLNDPDPDTGFRAIGFMNPEGEEGTPSSSRESFTVQSSGDFGLPESFWDWLNGDAELKREFDRMIEVRVGERVNDRFETLKDQVRAEAIAEGKQLGLVEAASTLADITQQLNKACAEVIKEKSKLLHSHENTWIKAFSHLLRRFLIPGQKMALDQIGVWLSESIGAFDAHGKIKVHLSSRDFAMISPVVNPNQEQRWVFVDDPSVMDGQIHCQCDDGGILFNSEEEMTKLDQWVDRFVSRGEGEIL